MKVECLIVGGGLIGMLTARELVNEGCRVTIVEKGQVGKESSWAGGGILSPLYPWRYPEAITQLASWSQQHYAAITQHLLQETGVDPEYTRSGLLMLDVKDAEAAKSWARRFQYEYEEVASGDVGALEPAVSKEYHNGSHLYLPQVAQLRNPRMLLALRRFLEKKGVRFLENMQVNAILSKQGIAQGVRAENEVIKADRIILASGAWTHSLLSTVQVNIDIFPVQGQMVLFKTLSGLLQRIVMHKGFYVIPRRDGHVLAGSTMEYRGFDKTPTDEWKQQLRAVAISLMPALADYPLVKHWAGLRPGSPQGVPSIGEVPGITGLYVNSGHFRNGVVMGPASARLLADLILKREPIVDPQSYQLAPS